MREIIKTINQFVAEFQLPTEFPDCYSKCVEEDKELELAMTHKENVEEAADRVITGIRLLQSLHVDPEQAVKDKLEETYAKYAARRDNEKVE